MVNGHTALIHTYNDYPLDLACEKHNNPADFYLDKIIKSEEIVKDAQSAVTDEAKGTY